MKDQERPVAPVFTTALYSDAGYAMLGRVLERLTNQSYEDALQTHLAKPLGLESTGSIEPKAEDRNALAIPGNATVSTWGKDNPITAP